LNSYVNVSFSSATIDETFLQKNKVNVNYFHCFLIEVLSKINFVGICFD
jgi:hypothetical protein